MDYIYKELPKIPDNIPVLVLGNHCDMNHHRSVNEDEIVYYLKTLERYFYLKSSFVLKIKFFKLTISEVLPSDMLRFQCQTVLVYDLFTNGLAFHFYNFNEKI